MKMRAMRLLGVLALIVAAPGCPDDETNTPTGDTSTFDTGDTSNQDGTGDSTTPDGTTPDTEQDTNKPDGTTPDATPDQVEDTTEPDEILCFEVLPCVIDECQGLQGTAQQQCFQQALATTCAASNQNESTLFTGYLNCLGGCQQTSTGDAALLECVSTQCREQENACNTGGTFGSGNCLQLNQCLAGCGQLSDGTCERNCYSSASEQANDLNLDALYCANLACVDTPTGACLNGALQPGGACEDYANACQSGMPVEPGPEVVEQVPDVVEPTPDAVEETIEEVMDDTMVDTGPDDVTPPDDVTDQDVTDQDVSTEIQEDAQPE